MYLETQKIGDILDDIIKELLRSKPEDPIPLILHVLETKSGNSIPPLSRKEEVELMHLKSRWKSINEGREGRSKSETLNGGITIKVEEAKGSKDNDDTDTSDTSSSDGDDSQTFSRSALLKAKPMAKKPPRSSVSAEAMGLFSKRAVFKPVVIPKDEDTKKRITRRLMESFMFKNLEDKDMEIVVDAMQEISFKENETIIKQGDEGNHLYVLESGEWECYKLFPTDKVEKKLREYVPGEAFGELALLYNAPRAATIKASEDWVLFALDRKTFNNIVKDSAKKNRETYEEFFKSVDFFGQMDYYERVSLWDAVRKEKFKEGDFVIKEGEPGDSFYFLLEGTAVAKKDIEGTIKNVMDYNPGDYFGERALLKDEPRAASIVATSQSLVLAKLESRSFKRLLAENENVNLHLLKHIHNL